MVSKWQSPKKFPTSVTHHAQGQVSSKSAGGIAEVSAPAQMPLLSRPVSLRGLRCWLISPEAISICQGKFDNGENQKWEDGVLTAHCGIPLRNQIPLAALSITDEEDGMVGVAGGGGTMSSLHLR